MKQIVIVLFVVIQLSAFNALAQIRHGKVESIKVAYLSEKLNLDPKTAERFWPVYNQYDDEMHNAVNDLKRGNDTRSADQILDREQRTIDIKRKYSAQFLKVISNEQLGRLFQSEKEFNQILLRRMNKMENRQKNMREGSEEERFRNRPMRNQSRLSEGKDRNATIREGRSDEGLPRKNN